MHVLSYKTVMHHKINFVIKTASTRKDLGEKSCFVFVIGTHGEEAPSQDSHGTRILEHQLFGSDGETVRTQTLIDKFDESACPALAGKPKLFFIQVCITIYIYIYVHIFILLYNVHVQHFFKSQ